MTIELRYVCALGLSALGVAGCSSDSELHPDLVDLSAAVRDAAPADLSPTADLASCEPGTKLCGGRCVPTVQCCTNADCPNTVCIGGNCAAPSCSDGLRNGNETDIDCGGGSCGRCVATRACALDSDCRSNLCAAGACREVDFTRSDFGGGAAPRLLRTVDLDNDGWRDVIALDADSFNLSTLLSRGDGTFRSVGSFTAGVAPVEFDMADLNGDSAIDVVVANSASYDVSVLLGRGDGTFAPERREKVSGQPTWVAIGDQDHDGKKDIVVANSSTGTVGLLLGNGDGTFRKQTELLTWATRPRALVLRDVDTDGFDDVVVQCVGVPPLGTVGFTGGTLSFYRSRPQGGFDAPIHVATASPLLTTLFAEDLNHDGKVDAIVAGTTLTNPQVFVVGAMGGFQLLGAQPPVFAPWAQPVDMNGDNVLDLVSASGVQLGAGNGSFGAVLPYPSRGEPSAAPAAADYNLDGKLDVALASPSTDSVVALVGHGDGTLAPLSPPKAGSETDLALISPRVTAITDLNGDGRGDLLVASGTTGLVTLPSLLVRLSDGKGGLVAPVAYAIGKGADPSGIATGDFNKDKNVDVLVCSASEPIAWLLTGSANGTLNAAVAVPLAGEARTCAAGDLDGDGSLDLAVADITTHVEYQLGNGDGTFRRGGVLTVGKAPRQVILMDWNGDKSLDIITVNRGSSNLSWVLSKGVDMNNVLSFSPAINVAPPGFPAPSPIAAAFADLDGDNLPDMLLADNSSANFAVYRNTTPQGGAITFAQPASYRTLNIPTAAVAADFNLDGKIDFATTNNADRSVSVFLGRGGLQFTEMMNHDVGVGPVWITVGDLNGDKKPDLATANLAARTVTVLMNAL